MKIKLTCEKCGKEKIKDNENIYVCCGREMQRELLENEKKDLKGKGD